MCHSKTLGLRPKYSPGQKRRNQGRRRRTSLRKASFLWENPAGFYLSLLAKTGYVATPGYEYLARKYIKGVVVSFKLDTSLSKVEIKRMNI